MIQIYQCISSDKNMKFNQNLTIFKISRRKQKADISWMDEKDIIQYHLSLYSILDHILLILFFSNLNNKIQTVAMQKSNQPHPNLNLSEIHETSQMSSLQFSVSQSIYSGISNSNSGKKLQQQRTGDRVSIIMPKSFNPKIKDWEQQSNLLDSTMREKNELSEERNQASTQKKILVESQRRQKVHIVSEISERSKQIILQSEVIELQVQCSFLVKALKSIGEQFNIDIDKYLKKMSLKRNSQQVDESLNSFNENSSITQTSFSEQIQMFNFIETFLKDYKLQLQHYQKEMIQTVKQKQEKISMLQKQTKELQSIIFQKNAGLDFELKNNREMERKNRQLILDNERLKQQLDCFIRSQSRLKFFSSEKKGEIFAGNMNKIQRRYDENYSPISPFPFLMRSELSTQLDISIDTKYNYMYKHPLTPSTKTQYLSDSCSSFTLKEYEGCLREMELIIEKLAFALENQLKQKFKAKIQVERLRQENATLLKSSKLHSHQKQQVRRKIEYHQQNEKTGKQNINLNSNIHINYQNSRNNLQTHGKQKSRSDSGQMNNHLRASRQSPGLFASLRNQIHCEYGTEAHRSDKESNSSGKKNNIFQLNKPRPSFKGQKKYEQ